MEEPPDPGGSVPPVGNHVTIETTVPTIASTLMSNSTALMSATASNESGMETDGSICNRSLKRARPNKMCRHCNKRRRKRNSVSEPKENDCICSTTEVISEAPMVTKQPDSTPVVPSNDNIRPRPSPIGREFYESTDVAPYLVHIQKESNPDDSTVLHPIAFGKLLQKQQFTNIVNGSLKRIGRNKIALAFTHFDAANMFLRHESLPKNKLKAFIPTFNLTRMGLVRGVPAEWSPEQVTENINVAVGCGKIIKIRRLNYKTTVNGSPVWKPSQTVVITFDGQVLPKRIFMCFNALPVELYTYPTIQCYNCCRFGHTKMQCRSKPRCFKCGQEHTADSCSIEDDCSSCCLCSGSHYATSKSCPEFNRQKRIKQSMAECCISYSEACKLHPQVSKSYADVIATSRPSPVIGKMPPPSSSNMTYRKTVLLKPRSARQPSKGYDQAAHQQLIKNYDMPPPANGSALKAHSSTDNEQQSLTNIIVALISTLSQTDLLKPDNAAPIIELLKKIIQIHNGSKPSNEHEL